MTTRIAGEKEIKMNGWRIDSAIIQNVTDKPSVIFNYIEQYGYEVALQKLTVMRVNAKNKDLKQFFADVVHTMTNSTTVQDMGETYTNMSNKIHDNLPFANCWGLELQGNTLIPRKRFKTKNAEAREWMSESITRTLVNNYKQLKSIVN